MYVDHSRSTYIVGFGRPFVQISIPAGSLPTEKKVLKVLIINLVTEAVVEAEGILVTRSSWRRCRRNTARRKAIGGAGCEEKRDER